MEELVRPLKTNQSAIMRLIKSKMLDAINTEITNVIDELRETP